MRTALATLVLAAATGSAAEYVVSERGDDANPGSREAPFRTLGRAAGLLRPGDTCLVRGGVYRESVVLRDLGAPDAPIRIEAWPGETPVLSGTRPLEGWTRVEPSLWQCSMPWSLGRNNQVFVDGAMATEARWPNRSGDDFLEPEGAAIGRGGSDFLTCDDLPERPEDYWRGAVLWCLAGAKWTSWTAVVKGYDAAGRRLSFELPDQGSIAQNMNPGDRRGGVFHLSGIRGELDAPNEWFVEEDSQRILFRAADGVDMGRVVVEARERLSVLDLTGCRNVQVRGLRVFGATVRLTDCEGCVLQGLRLTHISHTRGGRTGYSLGEETGILISGRANRIRDCEVAYSVGDGIRLAGEGHAVINCWIHHIDSSGSYGAPVKCSGSGHLISHNTIHDAGRDCMQPGGQAHIIQYNHIYNMGRIAHDLGATYVCGQDGGGTEFRFNWCHDNRAAGTRMGIYLDNFTSNYFVHHNVCWNIRGDAIRLNKPSLYNIVAHNTMLDNARNWGRWKSDWMYGCLYANNAVQGTIQRHPQAVFRSNIENVPAADLSPPSFRAWAGGRSRGVFLPGLSASGEGGSADVGAYGAGVPDWVPGHDFEHPPEAAYAPVDTPLRNLVRHGSFDWQRWAGQLGPWKATHAGAAAIVRGPGGIVVSYAERNTVIHAGAALQGDGDDGIEQTIEGLRPQQDYDLAAWVRLEDAAEVRLGIRDWGGEPLSASSKPAEGWQQIRLRFRTGNTVGATAVVSLLKPGGGRAFVDDVGLVGILPGMEPAEPGPLPAPD
ncbi:MAG: right-handed parallel beta-helix repeat-containing protein [Lentisphaeria bacterium]|nr:right-handed parallel beta-helix repeat-containing protein [Lentisphaeria bacterium]